MLIFPFVILQKHTPLYIAMANDHIDIVRRLLYNGADCRTIDDIVSIVIIVIIILYANFLHYPFISLDKRHLLIFTNLS